MMEAWLLMADILDTAKFQQVYPNRRTRNAFEVIRCQEMQAWRAGVAVVYMDSEVRESRLGTIAP